MSLNPIERLFYKVCENIRVGTLSVKTPDGKREIFGDGDPQASIDIHDWKVITSLVSRGDIGFGETYSDGLWDSPDIEALILLVLKNQNLVTGIARGSMIQRLFFILKDRVFRRNSRAGSQNNISAHYDVGNDFYKLWLDETMTYSSALFDSEDISLEDAQLRKYDRLLGTLNPDGERILEIGCGWGGFADRAAVLRHNMPMQAKD